MENTTLTLNVLLAGELSDGIIFVFQVAIPAATINYELPTAKEYFR